MALAVRESAAVPAAAVAVLELGRAQAQARDLVQDLVLEPGKELAQEKELEQVAVLPQARVRVSVAGTRQEVLPESRS